MKRHFLKFLIQLLLSKNIDWYPLENGVITDSTYVQNSM